MMKFLFIAFILISSSIIAKDFYNLSSPEEAAQIILRDECGEPGVFISSYIVDEDYDFQLSFIKQNNGSAHVYSLREVVENEEIIYFNVAEFECY